ncbi:RICIN domain-containing protein [Luteolibacter sp. LG18]|uniref:RICIN domain-containing protein n=1 Tax=Luteolibacter sp. LG18 TaxID=2819286 RepID=UPI002B29D306|nr:hypothetical protein llg_41680 [Luteolibacter sp. LG18]
MNKNLLSSLGTIAAVVTFACCPAAHGFNHPSAPFTLDDLTLLKSNITREPWKTGYDSLASQGQSQLTYTMQGPYANVSRAPDVNLNQWRNDMSAVYNLARMWWFTGNAAYAQKAHDILIAWADTQTSFTGGEANLDLGDYAICYVAGADILRGTWPGWTQTDTDKVKNLFLNVYFPSTAAGGNVLGPANKGALSMAAAAGMAAFGDDQAKFDHVVDLFRASASSGLPNTLSSGQIGETGRDFGHAYGQWRSLSLAAEFFWKQGVDVYSELDNRLLAIGDYDSRNNLGVTPPYVTYGSTDYYLYWTNQPGLGWTATRRGLEILNSAYVVRKGLSAPYIQLRRQSLPVDSDSFMFCKAADTSVATPPAAVTYPASALTSTGLTSLDIGGATPAGSSSYANGIWTVTGGGSEIWTYGNDSCHFAYRQVTGDFSITAKVESLQNTSGAAKIGVMFRDSLAANAGQRAWVAIKPGQNLEYHMRGWTNVLGGTNWDKGSRSFPDSKFWVKIQRVGRIVALYVSADGTSWAGVGEGDFSNLGSTNYIGLVVCSMANGTPNTATFSNVSMTGGNGVAPVWAPEAPRGVLGAPGAGKVPLRWLSSAGATSYKVKRSTTSGSGYTTIATVSGTSYIDTAVTNGTPYYYVVSAVNSTGEGANSPEDAVTPVSPMANVAFGGTASSYSNTSTSASAFDGNSGAKWYAGSNAGLGAIQYDQGAGRTAKIKRYSITSANDVPARDPKDWQFQGSNDGTNWTTLDSRSNVSFPYRHWELFFAVASPASYRYHRLNITATGGENSTQIGDLSFLSDEGTLIPADTYRLFNRKSNKAMDVQNGATTDGTPIIQWSGGSGDNQKWTFADQGGGQYRVDSVASGKTLEVNGGSTSDGAALVIRQWNGGNHQKWTAVPVGDGYFRFAAVHTGKSADVSGGSTANGAAVIQWPNNTGTNQQWWVSPAP